METLSLDNFEEIIDQTILGRGQEYFRNHLVAEVTEKNNQFVALVQGSEVYRTELTLDGQVITSINCTCPYTFGPFCKHEVALIYEVNQTINWGTNARIEPPTSQKSKSKMASKRPSIHDIIKSFDRTELEEIVLNFAMHNRDFLALIKRHAPIDENQENLKSIYKEQIRNCVQSAGAHHGFVDYAHAHQAALAANELVAKARRLLKQKRFSHAFQIFQALLEEVYVAVEMVDDSDGNFNLVIDNIWGGFEFIVEATSNESSLAHKMFTYFLGEADKQRYNGWLLEYDFCRLASSLVRNKSDIKKLFEKLEKLESRISDDDDSLAWRARDLEKGIEIKVNTYRLLKDDKSAEDLIEKNMHHPVIRMGVIQKLLAKQDLTHAKKLAHEGLELSDATKFFGVSRDYEDLLLSIAEKENDIERIRYYFQKFFCEKQNFHYYDLLKKTFSKKEWPPKLTELLQILAKDRQTILDIYLKENKRDLFLKDIIKQCQEGPEKSLYLLDRYHKYMTIHFCKTLLDLYGTTLKKLLPNMIGRPRYQELCRYLRRMKKIGGTNEVNDIVMYCQTEYRHRPALQDELSRI